MTCEAASGIACFCDGKVAEGTGGEMISADDVESLHARLIDEDEKKGGEGRSARPPSPAATFPTRKQANPEAASQVNDPPPE